MVEEVVSKKYYIQTGKIKNNENNNNKHGNKKYINGKLEWCPIMDYLQHYYLNMGKLVSSHIYLNIFIN